MSAEQAAAQLFDYALTQCLRLGGERFAAQLEFYRQAGPPERISDDAFLRTVAETIICTGLSGPGAGRVLARLEQALRGYAVSAIAHEPEAVAAAAMAAFRHRGKVQAVLTVARWLHQHPSIGPRLARLEPAAARRLLMSFPWVGATNSGWLARALGIEAVSADRYVTALAQSVGRTAPELVRAVAAAAGERVGVVDYLLWYWVDRARADAFAATQMFLPASGSSRI